MRALVLFTPVPYLCRRFLPRRPELHRGAPRRARDDPPQGAHSAAPSPDSPTRPTPATRTAACRSARATTPSSAANRASGNPRYRHAPAPAYQAFVLTCVIGFPRKLNTYIGCFPNLLAYERHRLGIERHRDGLARFGLIGMNPRQLSRQIHLLPLQTRDICCSQARRERECRHVRQMLRQFGEKALCFFMRQKANAAGRFPQHTNLRGPI